QFSKGNFLQQMLPCQALQPSFLVVTLFSGDFYNISHSPIEKQAFFYFFLFPEVKLLACKRRTSNKIS
ncbi:hypothetical protein, partial [Paenibacillus elgii]|uniref:hypothetical protein n=1 Tax=Paenibacillus elgii TaxID=189691 RepID=UPI001E309C4F